MAKALNSQVFQIIKQSEPIAKEHLLEKTGWRDDQYGTSGKTLDVLVALGNLCATLTLNRTSYLEFSMELEGDAFQEPLQGQVCCWPRSLRGQNNFQCQSQGQLLSMK